MCRPTALILLHMCPHTAVCVCPPPAVYMCPHTTHVWVRERVCQGASAQGHAKIVDHATKHKFMG